jgi:hypothetical protein
MKPSTIRFIYILTNAIDGGKILHDIEKDDIILLPFDDRMTALSNPTIYTNFCHFL